MAIPTIMFLSGMVAFGQNNNEMVLGQNTSGVNFKSLTESTLKCKWVHVVKYNKAKKVLINEVKSYGMNNNLLKFVSDTLHIESGRWTSNNPTATTTPSTTKTSKDIITERMIVPNLQGEDNIYEGTMEYNPSTGDVYMGDHIWEAFGEQRGKKIYEKESEIGNIKEPEIGNIKEIDKKEVAKPIEPIMHEPMPQAPTSIRTQRITGFNLPTDNCKPKYVPVAKPPAPGKGRY